MAAVGRRAEKARRDLTDVALAGKADQLRQRKPGAAVFGRGMGAIIGDVGDAQVVRVSGVAVIDRVEFRPAIIERAGSLVALAGIEGGGGGDEGDAGVFSGFLSGWNGAEV